MEKNKTNDKKRSKKYFVLKTGPYEFKANVLYPLEKNTTNLK